MAPEERRPVTEDGEAASTLEQVRPHEEEVNSFSFAYYWYSSRLYCNFRRFALSGCCLTGAPRLPPPLWR